MLGAERRTAASAEARRRRARQASLTGSSCSVWTGWSRARKRMLSDQASPGGKPSRHFKLRSSRKLRHLRRERSSWIRMAPLSACGWLAWALLGQVLASSETPTRPGHSGWSTFDQEGAWCLRGAQISLCVRGVLSSQLGEAGPKARRGCLLPRSPWHGCGRWSRLHGEELGFSNFRIPKT